MRCTPHGYGRLDSITFEFHNCGVCRSVFEEDGEQGVAHITEHLAFNATKDFKNHEIVHFLQSIGSELGACQNAYTSYDETVYQILVPIDKPDILSQSFHVLAEWCSEVSISPLDDS